MWCHVQLPRCPQSPREEALRLVYFSLRRGPASSICNSLIKTGLQLYLHVTFSHPWKQFRDKCLCCVGSRRDAESSEWPFPLILAAYGSVHAGYRCPHADCPVLAYTWGKLQKHVAKHPGRVCCGQSKNPPVWMGSPGLQPGLRARCVRRCSRRWICCEGTSAFTLPTSLCWFAPGKTVRPTSPQHLTCSTISARCTSIFSNLSVPSLTVHACLPCGWVKGSISGPQRGF